jgi:hypothetical protein
MKEIFILTTITGLSFIFFIITFILGLTRKKKKLLIISLIALPGFIALALWTGYTVIHKTADKLTGALAPRTGEEIYRALFGPDPSGCVKIIHAQDQLIPRIDPAIWLKFKTCPAELQRILSLHPFDYGKVPTASWKEGIPYGETLDWVNPQAMGDTILVFEYASDDGRNIQTLWASADSTQVLCRDILD